MKAKLVCLSAMAAVFLVSLAGVFFLSAGMERFPFFPFVYALQSECGSVRVEKPVSSDDPIFSGEPTNVVLGGEPETTLTLLRYPSAESAAREASCVEPDGFTVNFPAENGVSRSVMISWISSPHYYLCGDTIVIYVGNDEELLSRLESLLGPPFAGWGSSGDADAAGTLTAE